MMGKTIKQYDILFMVLFIGFCLMAVLRCYSHTAKDNLNSNSPTNHSDPNKGIDAVGEKAGSVKMANRPMIIWFHGSLANTTESLKIALSSGLITHVVVSCQHRYDTDWKDQRCVREAIEIVKKADAKLIWCRNLWPYYAIDDTKYENLFDPLYYIREISHLQAEAKEMGADFVAFDAEPYGNSPLQPYLKQPNKWLSKREVERLKETIRKVVEKTGKVDFIWPAGWLNFDHAYVALAGLGENRVSECTFYDYAERLRALRQDYEIFGAYINTTKENKNNSKLPYFLPGEIFEKSELWSHKKGLFLYTDSSKSLAVAKGLAAFAKTLPVRDSVISGDPNSFKKK
jgi:hypothetical protein